ncbi:hypothetical protein SPHINGO391_240028 [Sphingomonas aurantiaca]|uniref:Uncharacterized protein n=1 Tax=Sphingomonas aurantiaca TaxID=185949 RepID=A0A5E7XWL5_9SPHN|nr:hypothetical protein SPHINGO391_240028 [Sphingomonas aurantiaca]
MRGNEERLCLCLENVLRGGVAARKISVLNPDLNGYDWGLFCPAAVGHVGVYSCRSLFRLCPENHGHLGEPKRTLDGQDARNA